MRKSLLKTGCIAALLLAVPAIAAAEERAVDAPMATADGRFEIASITTTGAGKPVSAGGGRQFAGDVAPGALAYWGVHVYLASQAGDGTTKLLRLRNSAGTPEQCDFLSAAVTGTVGLTASASCTGSTGAGVSDATFCATGCTVVTLYDTASGMYHATTGTVALQPTYVMNCIGTVPCLLFNGSNTLPTSTPAIASQPLTVAAVALRDTTGGNTTENEILAHSEAVFFANGGGAMGGYFGFVASKTTTDDAFHAFSMVANGGSSTINIDGATSTVNPGSLGFASGVFIGAASSGGASGLKGKIGDIGLWSADMSSAQSSLNTVFHTNFGF